ncbi:MAG: hypothetical protein IJH64_05210 [Oscillospiraceae bacterium]|nr:hypothetical protein [Oscillospiraceae bacterium]
MEDLSRNTDEVIMQIHNVFRYADPVFRLTTIGAVKLIQFLARMAKEKQISQVEIEDFGKFLKATDGKYDIMNIPATDKEILREEMDNLGIRFSIMPDLDKEDGLMQLAVYQPDREKFGSWYERFLISRMQGGEKELKELRGLTRGNVSIVSFPLEGRDEGMAEDFQSLGINYARLPDLRVGDGSIQFEIANSDMGKVNQWYKLKQRDMLHEGEELQPMETISMEQYQQTGAMSEQDYMDTAAEEMKKANEKYEGKEKGSLEKLAEEKGQEIKKESSSAFQDHVNDSAYIPVTINKRALVDRSIVSSEMRERFAERGQFCCRVPGTWENGKKQEHILMVPLKDVFVADEGKTYIAFLDKRHLPLVLHAGNGTPATTYFGMKTQEFAEKFFHEVEADALTTERIVEPAKSLAETVTLHLKQPHPPVMAR